METPLRAHRTTLSFLLNPKEEEVSVLSCPISALVNHLATAPPFNSYSYPNVREPFFTLECGGKGETMAIRPDSRMAPPSPAPTPEPLASTLASAKLSESLTLKKVIKRKRITQAQLATLLREFKRNDIPGHQTRERLARELFMTPREVQVWFQNRRAKINRNKACVNIQPRGDPLSTVMSHSLNYPGGMEPGPGKYNIMNRFQFVPIQFTAAGKPWSVHPSRRMPLHMLEPSKPPMTLGSGPPTWPYTTSQPDYYFPALPPLQAASPRTTCVTSHGIAND